MNELRPGNLVRITRASVGIPKDTIGLIVKARVHDAVNIDVRDISHVDEAYTLFHVQLVTDTKLNGQVRRYLAQDLKLIS